MAGPILNVGQQGIRLAHKLQNAAGDIQVGPFVPRSEIVNLPIAALMQDGIQTRAVVHDVNPIPHLQPIPVNRNVLPLQGPGNDEGNKFFRVLVRTVIICAPRDNNRKSISAEVGTRQEVGAGFAGGVGAVGGERGIPP